MGENKTDEEFTLSPRLLNSYIIPGLIALWFVAIIMIPLASWFINGVRLENLGQYGDSLGIVNSLFSALAVVGVLMSLRVQQREVEQTLKLAREERDEERLRQFRAATPVIEIEKEGSKTHKKQFVVGLKNVGLTIYDVKWKSSNNAISIESTPKIVGGGSSFNLELKWDTGAEFQTLLPLGVTLECYDIAGNDRTQTYQFTKSYLGFECIDHGIFKESTLMPQSPASTPSESAPHPSPPQ